MSHNHALLHQNWQKKVGKGVIVRIFNHKDEPIMLAAMVKAAERDVLGYMGQCLVTVSPLDTVVKQPDRVFLAPNMQFVGFLPESMVRDLLKKRHPRRAVDLEV